MCESSRRSCPFWSVSASWSDVSLVPERLWILLHAAWSQGDPRKVIYPTDSRGQFCGQAGTPLEWVTRQHEPDPHRICPYIPAVFESFWWSYSWFTALTQQGEASPVLLQHPEVCQSSGAAGVPVPHHAGPEHHPLMFISTFCLFTLLVVMTVCCCLCPVMCEKLSGQAPDFG